jgi:hypothetical protein
MCCAVLCCAVWCGAVRCDVRPRVGIHLAGMFRCVLSIFVLVIDVMDALSSLPFATRRRSLYTTRGVSESAVAGGRDVEEMRKIFDMAGFGATHDFDKVWEKAVGLAGGGPVSVAIFQEALM